MEDVGSWLRYAMPEEVEAMGCWRWKDGEGRADE
jgi:hypothetical protein